MIIYAYTQLNNIFEIFEEYLQFKINEKNSIHVIDESEYSLNNRTNINHNYISNKSTHFEQQNFVTLKQFENFRNLFRIFKELKTLPSINLLNEEKSKSKDFAYFYCVTVEKIRNYEGCLQLMNEYKSFIDNNKIYLENQANAISHNKSHKISDYNFHKCFGTNLNEHDLNEMAREYVDGYYENQETKSKRVYKTENAGLNWTKEDIEKFNEGMKRFGHMQLANIKIAKFMGTHIEPSHVKLFRGRISREKRMKRKFEKIEKITEMKKKRNLKWKVYEGELESIAKSEIN
jgi:hypothetical protein